jgi:hypothetical protein
MYKTDRLWVRRQRKAKIKLSHQIDSPKSNRKPVGSLKEKLIVITQEESGPGDVSVPYRVVGRWGGKEIGMSVVRCIYRDERGTLHI